LFSAVIDYRASGCAAEPHRSCRSSGRHFLTGIGPADLEHHAAIAHDEDAVASPEPEEAAFARKVITRASANSFPRVRRASYEIRCLQAAAVPAGHDAKPIVLDLMQPSWLGQRRGGPRGRQGSMKWPRDRDR
jgi:hypothetical protein